MIELKPYSYRAFNCPGCKMAEVTVRDTVFQGIHTLAECRCESCGLEFYHEFPVGNALRYPTVFGKNDGRLYEGVKAPWYSKPLLDSFQNRCEEKIGIEKKVYSERKEVVILNCLDFLYGHVVLKLFNAQYYLDHRIDLGLVVIVPKSFEWLVPEGVAELWLVDVKLYEGSRKWFSEFNRFVNNELERFDKVYLSLAFSVPDFSRINISRFTGVEKFDLSRYEEQRVTMTFVAREDRLWFGSKFEHLAYRVLRKLNMLKYFNTLFVQRQNRRITHTFRKIAKAFPGVQFNVVGLSESGTFDSSITDARSKKVDRNIEQGWCEIYARSHLVIGVHGSNMLLPTALAAGFIEILPKTRLGNVVQDIASSHTGRRLLFLGRFAREFATPAEIAAIAISMVRDFNGFNLYMDYEVLKHDFYADLRGFRA